MVNGIVSWISLPDLSLLVCRNATEFHVLICNLQLYQIHWWALVVLPGSFLTLHINTVMESPNGHAESDFVVVVYVLVYHYNVFIWI